MLPAALAASITESLGTVKLGGKVSKVGDSFLGWASTVKGLSFRDKSVELDKIRSKNQAANLSNEDSLEVLYIRP